MDNKQSVVEFLESRIKVLIPEDIGSQLMFKSNVAKAKEMEKQLIIDAHKNGEYLIPNIENVELYYTSTYGSKGSDECQFEPSTNTSSSTICKHCGKEKFLHQ